MISRHTICLKKNPKQFVYALLYYPHQEYSKHIIEDWGKTGTDTSIIKYISEIGWSFMSTLSCYRPINQNVTIQIDIWLWVWFQITSYDTVSGHTLQHKVVLRTHPCWLNLFCCSPAPSLASSKIMSPIWIGNSTSTYLCKSLTDC